MTKKKNEIERPVDFIIEKDVLGQDKPLAQQIDEYPENTNVSSQDVPHVIKRKSPWLTALLSLLLPGLGQLYAGKVRNALFFYAVFIALVIFLRLLAFDFTIFIGLVAIVVCFYVFGITHSFITLKRNRIPADRSVNKWLIYPFILIVHFTVVRSTLIPLLDQFLPLNLYSIQSTSMQPTLYVGDMIAVQRTNNVGRNDLVVFTLPANPTTHLIFRCMGVPGDEFRLENALVYVNNRLMDDKERIKFMYTMTTTGQPLSSRFRKKYEIEEIYPIAQSSFQVFLTERQAAELAKNSVVQELIPFDGKIGDPTFIYPNRDSAIWTMHDFGPLLIPKKNATIKLTKENLNIYAPLLYAENNTLIITDTNCYINNTLIKDYTFKKNYYFVLGDNRDNAMDSRCWGLVPEDAIIGKGLYVCWSEDFSRIGHRLN